MKTLHEFITDTRFKNVETIVLEDSTASSTMTQGVANPDAKPSSPMFKRKKYLGHPVIEVDDETYTKCIQGKQPFARWSKYVEDEDLRDEMKKTFKQSKRMLVMNAKTGGMSYIK